MCDGIDRIKIGFNNNMSVGLSFSHQNISSVAFKAQLNHIQELGIAKTLASQSTITSASSSPLAISRAVEISSKQQAIKNIIDANELISIAEGSLARISTKLTRMRALTVDAGQLFKTGDERQQLDIEFQSLISDIQTISTSTLANGRSLLDGSLGSVNFQTGSNENQILEVAFADLNTDFGTNEISQAGLNASLSDDLDLLTNLAVSNAGDSSGDESIDLASQTLVGNQQATTLTSLDTAKSRLDSYQGELTIAKEQLIERSKMLEMDIKTADRVVTNLTVIHDPVEISQRAKAQILQEAGAAYLTQANQSPSAVMSLLKED